MEMHPINVMYPAFCTLAPPTMSRPMLTLSHLAAKIWIELANTVIEPHMRFKNL